MAIEEIHSRLSNIWNYVAFTRSLLFVLVIGTIWFEYNYQSKLLIPEGGSCRQYYLEDRGTFSIFSDTNQSTSHGAKGDSRQRTLIAVNTLDRSWSTEKLPSAERCGEFQNGMRVIAEKDLRLLAFPELNGWTDEPNNSMTFTVSDALGRLPGLAFKCNKQGFPIPISRDGLACVVTANELCLLRSHASTKGIGVQQCIDRLDHSGITRCVDASQVDFSHTGTLLIYCGKQRDLSSGDRGSVAELYRITEDSVQPICSWETFPSYSWMQLSVSGDAVYSISPDCSFLEKRSLTTGNKLSSLRLPGPVKLEMDDSPFGFADGNFLLSVDTKLNPIAAYDLNAMRVIPLEITRMGKNFKILWFDSHSEQAWYGFENEIVCTDPFANRVLRDIQLPFKVGSVQTLRERNGAVIHSAACDLRWALIGVSDRLSVKIEDGLENYRIVLHDKVMRCVAWTLLCVVAFSRLMGKSRSENPDAIVGM